MGMDLKPIKPSENAPLYEGGEVQWGRYNWSGWSWLRTHLEDWGVDTSELTSMNDGATISEATCLKIADAIEAHLDELNAEDRGWMKNHIALWRTCGGYEQW
jgi:hypothetical protein